MKQEHLKLIADGATVSAVGAGGASSALKYLDFLDAHAAGLGVLCSAFFGLVGMVFYWLNLRKMSETENNKIEMENNKKQIDELKEQHREILNHLSNTNK